MRGRIENTYGRAFKYAKTFINPFKKTIIKTECVIHKFINFQALEILYNDNYHDAHNLFSDYILQLNEGVVWADQDLKSSGHFYNPSKEKGLYGNTNALVLAKDYYSKALGYWNTGNNEGAMFYLGATAHLIQDMTVPQHANIKLLDNHRQYENFIKRTYINTLSYQADRGGYYMSTIEEYIRCNARTAIKIYYKLRDIEDDDRRFYAITKFTLPLAQRTTAGCFLRFYKDAGNIE